MKGSCILVGWGVGGLPRCGKAVMDANAAWPPCKLNCVRLTAWSENIAASRREKGNRTKLTRLQEGGWCTREGTWFLGSCWGWRAGAAGVLLRGTWTKCPAPARCSPGRRSINENTTSPTCTCSAPQKETQVKMTVKQKCYPGIVGGRQNDILAAKGLEELCIVFLLCCVRTAENLLKKEREEILGNKSTEVIVDWPTYFQSGGNVTCKHICQEETFAGLAFGLEWSICFCAYKVSVASCVCVSVMYSLSMGRMQAETAQVGMIKTLIWYS